MFRFLSRHLSLDLPKNPLKISNSQAKTTRETCRSLRDFEGYWPRIIRLKSAGEFEPKGSTILRDLILKMESRGRIGVGLIQDIIDTHRGLQVLDQIPAED